MPKQVFEHKTRPALMLLLPREEARNLELETLGETSSLADSPKITPFDVGLEIG